MIKYGRSIRWKNELEVLNRFEGKIIFEIIDEDKQIIESKRAIQATLERA